MKKYVFVAIIALLTSCSSSHLVSNWKNPDYVIFDAYKTLVVGMTQDEQVRVAFETKMKKAFSQRNKEAVRSIDLFDVAFYQL